MIYTIGHTESYHRYFREQRTPKKLGRCIDEGKIYIGGTVWETEAEARRYCPKNYSVFGVIAKWGKDTYFVNNQEDYPGSAHALLVTSSLVRLDSFDDFADAN